MFKEVSFERFLGPRWPTPAELRPYFFDPSLRDWEGRALGATNIDPKELPGWDEPTELWLTMTGNQFHGVLFQYRRFGARRMEVYYSKGDLRRLQEWAATRQGDLMPVGLFVPFEAAWEAVKEFIERDGALPGCIEWIDSDDLPFNTFPRLEVRER